MQRNVGFWLTIALSTLALVASSILLVDYVRPAPVFCDAAGACQTVKHTVFARPFGVPMPAFGIAGMLGIGLAAMLPGRLARIAQLALSSIAAVVAIALFAVQAKLGVLCPYCAVVDTSAILLAAIAFWRFQRPSEPPGGLSLGLGIAGLVFGAVVPSAIGFSRPLPRPKVSDQLPPPIAAEIERTGAGKVTIVDFADFECPFCRMTHAELQPVLEEQKDKVRVVRKHVPLRMHPHAADAARAACCAEGLGKGEEMANALFAAPVEELTPEGCERLAAKLGLDLERFRACVKDPATDARIEKDKEAFRASQGHGLPTIWVDRVKLEGAQERPALEAAIGEAARAL